MDDEDWDADISTNQVVQPKASFKEPSSFGISHGRGRIFRNTERTNQFDSQSINKYESSHQENSSSYPKSDGFRSRSDSNNNHYSSSSSSSNMTELMNIETRSISSIIGKAGATINNIRDRCNVKIIIPPREELQNAYDVDIKIIGGSKSDIDKAKDMIKEITSKSSSYGQPRSNDYKPSQTSSYGSSFGYRQTNNDNFAERKRSSYNDDDEMPSEPSKKSFNPFGIEPAKEEATTKSVGIDWDLIRSQPLQNLNKFKDHPPVVKDFYVENPEITAMSRDEVKAYRKENFNIMVEVFKKEKLSYSSSAKVEEDTRTPEEIEDYLFKLIPKPVKKIEHAFAQYPGIMDECKRQNFINPTPIQSQLWPILLKGGDCVGIAQTGTGGFIVYFLFIYT